MNHQFFETLLLSDTELTEAESAMLQDHLQTCRACRQLSDALKDVDNLFHNSAFVAPRPGFTHRWEDALAADIKKRQRTQVFSITFIGLVSIAVLFLLLGFTILPIFISPISVLWAELFGIVTWFSAIEGIINLLSTLFQAVFSMVPISMWVALTFAFLGLCAVWVVAFKQVTSPRRLSI